MQPDPDPSYDFSDELEFYHEAMTSQNTAVLVSTETSPVRVKIAGQDCCGLISPNASVNELDYLIASNPHWSFTIPASDLAAYRASSYGRYFPVNAVVGHSSNGETFSFVFNSKKQLQTIFMAKGSF